MYQSPPIALAWSRRHWIAALAAGALGCALAIGIIALARGDIWVGLRGSAVGVFQTLMYVWVNQRVTRRQPANAKRQRWVIAIMIIMIVLGAGKIGLDMLQGQPMSDTMSVGLAVGATIFGPLWIWGRYRNRLEQGR